MVTLRAQDVGKTHQRGMLPQAFSPFQQSSLCPTEHGHFIAIKTPAIADQDPLDPLVRRRPFGAALVNGSRGRQSEDMSKSIELIACLARAIDAAIELQ